MDAMELSYTILSFVIGLFIVVLLMWVSVPENKAYLLRRLFKRPYAVAVIRHGGGQLFEHVVCAVKKKDGEKAPTFTVNDREYFPIEKVTRNEIVVVPESEDKNGKVTPEHSIERETTESVVNFKSSVPVYFYNYDDSKPIALSGVDVEKKFRNPALLNAAFLQVWAIANTRVAKEIAALMKSVQSWDLRFWLILLASALSFIIGAYNLIQIQQVQSLVVTSHNILNQTITQSIPNLLG